jgi:hypothetical protein
MVIYLVRRFKLLQTSLVWFTLACGFILLFYFLPAVFLLIEQNAFTWLYEYLTVPERVTQNKHIFSQTSNF